jgi:hypothetical protein
VKLVPAEVRHDGYNECSGNDRSRIATLAMFFCASPVTGTELPSHEYQYPPTGLFTDFCSFFR